MSGSARCGLLIISDRCHRKEVADESGPALAELLRSTKHFQNVVEASQCVPDDQHVIREVLIHWADVKRLDFVITSGGTGFGVRDVTPEATSAIIDRTAHGMMSALYQQSYPHSILSRGVCGIRKRTLIVNFPGSPKACRECFAIIEPKISHIMELLKNDTQAIAKAHHETVATQPPSAAVGADDSRRGPAFRHRKSPFPIIPVPDAQQMMLKECDIGGQEMVSLRDALGRIVAEQITAKDPLPPFRASTKDGYAVLSADGDGERKVVGACHAGGMEDVQLVSGCCMRITTGAPVPAGADAVVQVEDTELVQHDDKSGEELVIRILKRPQSSQDIRPVGSDIAAGSVVADIGSRIDPACLGVLATCGIVYVPVYAKPLVGLLSTGDELVMPETSPLPIGKIRDSNKTVLLSTLAKHGFSAMDFGIASDKEDILIDAMRRALSVVDVLVLTGGVSMGEKDLVKSILTTVFGGTIHFGRVFMKPGLPTTFATVNVGEKKKLVFGLPGNPVSAAVTCNLFVLPALRKMSGYVNPQYTVVRAEVVKDVKLDPRPEFHRAVIEWTVAGKNWPVVHSTGNQISSRLLSVSGADVLMCLPAKTDDKTVLYAGDFTDTILL
ncbi:gephyrin-like [Paramacrobiotus metropolitanus]|uniref:gephyrin-like n=1 Tax=Paramacrobiotus metropolitanus TaxID=2943436 RepID=UPI0024456840|nr:gephyrin-like [Paramacrobiotus metropolitanus]